MRIALQLAYRNLIGAGLRTWLNVWVLSFVFVVIILFNGLLEGWSQQTVQESIKWEYGEGHLLHKDYDPLDPFTVLDGHGHLSFAEDHSLTPVLVRQATIYPQGRLRSILLKGIPVGQKTLALPTSILARSEAELPVLIGVRMAEAGRLKTGDQLLLRWRDKEGTFDAAEITVAGIFHTNVASVDAGQIWIPIEKLWEMTGLVGHASYYVAGADHQSEQLAGWRFASQDDLLSEFRELMKIEKFSSALFFLVLLVIALIAIFDTQVLSIFRRQKEIGTYVALGMSRLEVLRLFTIEGALYSVFGVVLGCLYGIPLFIWLSNTGISLPDFYQDMGINMPATIMPVFTPTIVIGTSLILILSATVVSLIPARKIVQMDPVNALKGRML